MAPVTHAQQSTSTLHNRKQSLQSKRNYLRRKKEENLRQARSMTSQILTNQRKLDNAQYILKKNQSTLTQTRSQLGELEYNINHTKQEYEALKKEARMRVRRIYTSGRTNMLQMLLDAEDIPTFMDRLTYKRYLVHHDKDVIDALAAKESQLKKQLADQQRKENIIGQSIKSIETLRTSISSRLMHDKKLRERYWKDAKSYERAERELLAESRKVEQEIKKLTKASTIKTAPAKATGGFSWPLRGTITSPFGYRRHPIHRKRLMHTGLDISRPHGYPIKASNGGTVIYAGWRGGYGKTVMINHGNIRGKNVVTLYAHMSSILTRKGASVSKGQTVGKVGSTGYATGPHLHFETRENGKPVNPKKYL